MNDNKVYLSLNNVFTHSILECPVRFYMKLSSKSSLMSLEDRSGLWLSKNKLNKHYAPFMVSSPNASDSLKIEELVLLSGFSF